MLLIRSKGVFALKKKYLSTYMIFLGRQIKLQKGGKGKIEIIGRNYRRNFYKMQLGKRYLTDSRVEKLKVMM